MKFSNFIAPLVVIGMGVTILPLISEQVALAASDPNLDTEVLKYVTPAFTIGLIGVGLGMVAMAFRRSFTSNLDVEDVGYTSEKDDETPVYQSEEKKKKKTTTANTKERYTAVYQEGKTKYDEDSN